MKKLLSLFLFLFTLVLTPHAEAAELSQDAVIVEDNQYIYVLNQADDELRVVVKSTETSKAVKLTGNPTAAVRYQNYLLIALNNQNYLDIVDVSAGNAGQPKLTLVGKLTLLQIPYDLAIDPADHVLWFSAAKGSGSLKVTPVKLNPNNITSPQLYDPVWSTGFSPSITFRGNEQILLDAPRDLLYVGNAGLSPDQFTKVDVSDIANPKPILRSADFGANGQDFALSPDGARLYFMAGGAPDYEAQIISTSDFSKLADLELGAYPQAVAADASLIYVGKADQIRVYSASTYQQLAVIPAPSSQEKFKKRGLIPGYVLTNAGLYRINSNAQTLDMVYDYLGGEQRVNVEVAADEGGAVRVYVDATEQARCSTSNCQYLVRKNSIVKFEAVPEQGKDFDAWYGFCLGTQGITCQKVVDEPVQVRAAFKSIVSAVRLDGVSWFKETPTKIQVKWQTVGGTPNCSLVYASHRNFNGDLSEFGVQKFISPFGTNRQGFFSVIQSQTYYFQVVCRDQSTAELVATSPIIEIPAVSASITGIKTEQLSDTSLRVSWNSSLEMRCSVVYDTFTIADDALTGTRKVVTTTSTSVEIPSLQEGERYYYRIFCRDLVTNALLTQSEQLNATLRSNAPTTPAEKNILIEAGFTDAYISWETNVPTTSHVRYGRGGEESELTMDVRASTRTTKHRLRLVDLVAGTVYYFRVQGVDENGTVYTSFVQKFTTKSQANQNPSIPSSEQAPSSRQEAALRDRIRALEYKVSQLEEQLVQRERELARTVDRQLTERLKGRILLQVEENGEAWYVDEVSGQKYYLRDGQTAYSALQVFGLGISNADLSKIPLGYDDRIKGSDSDGDGLMDQLEVALGLNMNSADTDGDGFNDLTELLNGYRADGRERLSVDSQLASRLDGKIVLQVESRGEAWYILDGKRYYMPNGELAYQIMRYLSLGVTNEDLRKISVGEFK